VVARRHARDPSADLDDHTCPLVSAEEGEQCRPAEQLADLGGQADVAGDDVLVGVAHAGHLPLHEDLADLRRLDLDLSDLPGLVEPTEDGGTAGGHVRFPSR
jgi:hypothetical protein